MWTFLNPLFLWAGVAVMVPLLLHLMQRRRSVRIRFSTLRFLKLAQRRSARRVRMENFLLWLVRTLLLASLALAFALPVMRLQGLGSLLGRANRDVAIVLDASYSMGYESAQRSVWAAARAAAMAVVDSLQPGDRVCLYLADEDVTPLIEQPTTDRDLARALVRAQRPQPGPSQLLPALMAAATTLGQSARYERELHVITDGQRWPWQSLRAGTTEGADATNAAALTARKEELLNKKLAIFVTLVGPPAPQNVSPTEVRLEPAVLMADTPGLLKARIVRTGPAANLAAVLQIDGREVARATVDLKENAAADIELAVPPLPAGVHPARLSVPADGLAFDDSLHFLLRARAALPVLCVGTAEDAFFLTRALNPGGRVAALTVTRADPAAVPGTGLESYACIFLCNAVPLSGQGVLALEGYVRAGGTLVVFPGNRGTAADYASWRCLPAVPAAAVDVPPAERVRTLRLVSRANPIFAGLKLPPGAAPTLSVQREAVWTNIDAQATALVTWGAGTPFLWLRPFGAGRTLAFSVAADRVWSTLPLSPIFLPLLHQIVRDSAGVERQPLYVWGARNVALTGVLPALPDTARLNGPDGQVVPLHVVREESRSSVYADDLRAPGIYRLGERQSAGEPILAVNADRRESDLRTLAARELPAAVGLPNLVVVEDREALLRRLDEHRRGRPLAEPLLWLALALAVAEVWLANRMSRVQKPVAVAVRATA